MRRTIEGSFGKANDTASELADERKTLAEAVELFVATKRNANCSRDVAKGYDVELSRFVSFVAGLKPRASSLPISSSKTSSSVKDLLVKGSRQEAASSAVPASCSGDVGSADTEPMQTIVWLEQLPKRDYKVNPDSPRYNP